MKYTKTQTQEALNALKEAIFPGDTIHTIVTHVSRSGMSRSIRTLVLQDGHRDISYLVARVLDERMDDKNGGLKVSGCGMDMGFETVYRLGYALFPDGFTCIGDKCPSSDHVNGMPRSMQYTKETCPGKPCSDVCDHEGSPNVIHKSGGYALRQAWL